MPNFSYKAKNVQGAVVSGSLIAENEKAFMDKLKQQRLTLVSMSKEGQGFDLKSLLGFLTKKRVSTKDISIFCRQFSVMINSGLPIMQGLTILSEQAENPTFGEVLRKVKDDISSGGTLADALAKHPKVFNELFVNMIRSGEAGGVLSEILERLSGYLEKAEGLKRKIKGAMAYPAVVLSVAGSVVIFIMVAVVPTFESVFHSFGAELPAPTRILIAVSNGLARYIIFGIIGGIIGFILFRMWVKTPKGRYAFDNFLLKLPGIGMLLKKTAVANFTSTLGTLIKSGVPILEALDTVARTSGNSVIEKVILKAKESVRKGEGFTDPLRESKIFPPMVTSMISVGEETGALDQMLMRISMFYEEEVNAAVEALTSMLEPLIIVFLGGTIGSIVVALFLPMFSLGSLVS